MNQQAAEERRAEREAMVQDQIAARGVRDPRVLEALRHVPRHRFISSLSDSYPRAYEDGALGIGQGQTISQPYIVGLMSEALHLQGMEKVLEIGAGSGYQTAVLSELCAEIVAVERHSLLAGRAKTVLDELEITNVRLFVGDGSQGWPALAPYDAILVAAVAPEVPQSLKDQLAVGGRLILPVGPEHAAQRLLLLTKRLNGVFETKDLGEVAFVPLVGAQGYGFPEDLGDIDI